MQLDETKKSFREIFLADLLVVINAALILVLLVSVYEVVIFTIENKYIEYNLYNNILFLTGYLYKTNLWLGFVILMLNVVWLFVLTLFFTKKQSTNSRSMFYNFLKGLPLLALILKYQEKHLTQMGIQTSLFIRNSWNLKTVSLTEGLHFYWEGIISLFIIIVSYFILFKLFFTKKEGGSIYNIKKKLKSLLFILLINLLFFLIPQYIAATSQDKKMKNNFNVLLIIIDALRADHLSCYGYNRKTSPNIDKLAEDGIKYTHSFSHSTHTSGTTPSILSSTYTTQHKIFGYIEFFDYSFVTIAELLLDAGYKTFGIVTNTHLTDLNGYHQGFQSYYSDLIWNKNNNVENVNEKFFNWLEKNGKNDKFFSLLFYLEPHTPYVLPQQFMSKFQENYQGKLIHYPGFTKKYSPEQKKHIIANYDGEINYFDYHFGKLIDRLKTMGIYDNTLIILTSDHGEAFWEHGVFGHDGGSFPHLYDELIHVPLIIKPPNKLKNKLQKYKDDEQNMLVNSVDIFPSIVDLLDIKLNEKVQRIQISGKSIFHDSNDNKTVDDFYPFVFCEVGKERKGIRTKRWKYIATYKPNAQNPDEEFTKDELYDIENDPGETKNLNHKLKITNRLKAILRKQVKEIKTTSFALEKVEVNKMMKKELKALGYIN
jgi:arylsulfatase A-like enzyme